MEIDEDIVGTIFMAAVVLGAVIGAGIGIWQGFHDFGIGGAIGGCVLGVLIGGISGAIAAGILLGALRALPFVLLILLVIGFFVLIARTWNVGKPGATPVQTVHHVYRHRHRTHF